MSDDTRKTFDVDAAERAAREALSQCSGATPIPVAIAIACAAALAAGLDK